MICANPARDRHNLKRGGRRLDVQFQINWGTKDLRDPAAKTYTFCSFACMAEWATERAKDHDDHVLKEGS